MIKNDHFVLIVGRGYDNEKRYFLYEVATAISNEGRHVIIVSM